MYLNSVATSFKGRAPRTEGRLEASFKCVLLSPDMKDGTRRCILLSPLYPKMHCISNALHIYTKWWTKHEMEPQKQSTLCNPSMLKSRIADIKGIKPL